MNDWYDKQYEAFEELAKLLGAKVGVVSTHTSHSTLLPVVRLDIGCCSFWLRDNGYDINVAGLTRSVFSPSISSLMEGVQEPHDWDWYLNEISRCRGYTWDYFTDEEMEDYRVLRVIKPHKLCPDRNLESTVKPDQKDRWLKRMTDPEWWSKDWSSGKLCWEGDFGPGVKLFAQYYPYMEGMDKVIPDEARCKYGEQHWAMGLGRPYKPGCSNFALAVGSLKQAGRLIQNLVQS